MIRNNADGSIVFTLDCPDADSVEVVGDFFGWDHQTVALDRRDDGLWHLRLDPPPGLYVFRYRINGSLWVLDGSTETIYSRALDCEVSRVYRPPLGETANLQAA